MTSTYRQSNLPLWTGVNRPLTFLESDSNIYDKESRCTTLEQKVATLSSGAGIDYFSVTGNQFYVHLTNHEILGPYPLPVVTFNFRQDGTPPGTWLPSTLYNSMDVFQHTWTLYVTNITHTSALSFDPHATDGLGHNLYSILFTQPQASTNFGLSPSSTPQSVDPTVARCFEVSPTASITFNAASTPDGAEIKFIFNSNGGSQIITFGTNFKPSATLSMGSVGAKSFTVSFYSDGTHFFETARAGPL
jgi:hypothetical protein